MDCGRRSYLGLFLPSWKEELQGRGPYFPLKRRGDKCSFSLSRNEAPWKGVNPHWWSLPLVWVAKLSPAPTARRGLGVGSCGWCGGVVRDEAGWNSHDLCILEGNIQRCSPVHPPGELPHRTGKSIVPLSAKSPIVKGEKRRDGEGLNGCCELSPSSEEDTRST